MLRHVLARFVKNAAARRYLTVAAFAVPMLLLTAAWLLWYGVSKPQPWEEPPPLPAVADEPLVLPAAEPVRLAIPKIDVDVAFEAPLGLKESGEIEVPEAYDTVAYYKYGPTPGELGPAVILGHVDSFEGPAVFFSLGQLKPGDQIMVTRADGSLAIFAVEALERHPQSGFPTVQVYGDLDHAGLRLITCSGTYDHGTLRYSHNLIVFAKLVGMSTPTTNQ